MSTSEIWDCPICKTQMSLKVVDIIENWVPVDREVEARKDVKRLICDSCKYFCFQLNS